MGVGDGLRVGDFAAGATTAAGMAAVAGCGRATGLAAGGGDGGDA